MIGKQTARKTKFRIADEFADEFEDDDEDDDEDDRDPGEEDEGGKSVKKGAKIDLRAHLLSMDKKRLAAMLLEQAVKDGALRERLTLSAAAANPDGMDLESLRQRIDDALELPDFDYDDQHWDEEDPYEGYAEQMKPVLAALKTLLEKGMAASVATLTEYALDELSAQCQEMEYDFVNPEELTHPLAALHARACSETRPDPLALADWLFRLGVQDAEDNFGDLPWKEYEPALGDAGLARFRQLAEAEWAAIPALKADEADPEYRFLRSRLRKIVMWFAERDGDVDAQAAIAKKDLSHPDGYLAAAKIYQSAQRHDEALEWAEKGWRAFRNGYGRDAELRDLLADEYRRKNRNAEAMELYWSEFSEQPCLARFQELRKQAKREGAWPAWRDKAFVRIRKLIGAAKKKKRERPGRGGGWTPYGGDMEGDGDHSLLVEILLWEKKPEEAWREAKAGDCSEKCWLRLSAWREKAHPGDCVPIWRRRVERLTKHAKPHDYAPAAESLVKLGALMDRIGAGKEFAGYMQTLREELWRRRNFIRELDKRELP